MASPAHASGAAGALLYRHIFVGRTAELEQLRAAVEHAMTGQGAVLALAGEPGIGKTSLCEQVAEIVAERGGQCLWGTCYEDASRSVPYLPFVHALGKYVNTAETSEVLAVLGSGATEIAAIVPEVRQRLDIDPRPPGDPEDDRWQLLQAVSSGSAL
jgi:predicted ATPase